jgi:hypothetical protein
MAHVEVRRHIAADPTSVALLLAGPLPDDSDEALEVLAPRRTGVGFTASLKLLDSSRRPVTGEVTIQPLSDDGCDARVVLRAHDERSARGVERAASTFLSRLAILARSRSFAA